MEGIFQRHQKKRARRGAGIFCWRRDWRQGFCLLHSVRRAAKKTDSAVSDAAEINAYAAALEEKARALCESASGVGRGSVTVTVTLDGGFDAVYAEDSEKKTSGTGESVTGKYATVGGGSSETPIKIGVRTPRIAGIGVVCRGGGDDVTRAELISLLSAAFGIGASKIYIAEAN